MPKFLLRMGEDGKLEKADVVSEDYLGRWPEREVRLCEVKKVRNPDHHRKAFAVLSFAQQNQELFPSVDALLEAVKVATGHVDELQFKTDGPIVYKTRSISFGQMGQDEFSDFYVRMLEALEMMTGIPVQTLEEGGRGSS